MVIKAAGERAFLPAKCFIETIGSMGVLGRCDGARARRRVLRRVAAPAPAMRPPWAPVRHGPRDRARVAFTFDDGPGRLTEEVLEVLRSHGARATFNVLGDRVAGRERLLRRTIQEGHEVGNHAMHHERLGHRPLTALRSIARTGALVQAATGVRPRVFRPPYGSASRGVVLAARVAGCVTVTWDVDPRDYEEPTAQEIAARTTAGLRPGSIVLLHDDRRALRPTVVALDACLAEAVRRGLQPVTCSELLAQ